MPVHISLLHRVSVPPAVVLGLRPQHVDFFERPRRFNFLVRLFERRSTVLERLSEGFSLVAR